MIRIWHQSAADLDALQVYRDTLRGRQATICAEGTEVAMHGVRSDTYPPGTAPLDAWVPYVRAAVEAQVLDNAITAEQSGFDAVAIVCFCDPALELARGAVEIPVLGTLESALLTASLVGRRVALLTLNRELVRIETELVARYAAPSRIFAVEHVGGTINEFDLEAAFGDGSDLLTRFVDAAKRLVARGADVIIPAENVMNTVMARHEIREVDGATVIDSYASLLGLAEHAARQYRAGRLRTGRNGAYSAPPRALRDHVRQNFLGQR